MMFKASTHAGLLAFYFNFTGKFPGTEVEFPLTAWELKCTSPQPNNSSKPSKMRPLPINYKTNLQFLPCRNYCKRLKTRSAPNHHQLSRRLNRKPAAA